MQDYRTRSRLLTALVVTAVILTPAVAMAQKVGPASNPSPSDGATTVATTTALSWSAGTDARRFDVRFGTQSPPQVMARNLTVTTYQPGPLAPGVTYYWQVDSRGKGNDVAPGPLWSFTTAVAQSAPAAPSGPSPANAATDVAISAALTWAASAGASTYDLAFGPSNPPTVVTNQAGTTYTPPAALAYATTYYWQITAKGAGGSTAGPVWSFTTIGEPTPAPAVPSGPSPVNAAADVAISAALTWAASTGAAYVRRSVRHEYFAGGGLDGSASRRPTRPRRSPTRRRITGRSRRKVPADRPPARSGRSRRNRRRRRILRPRTRSSDFA